MKTIIGGASCNGAGDIQKIAIAIGARAQNRIAEHDRIGFAPCDIGSLCWAVARLIRRAGPCRLAAELDVGARHAPGHICLVSRQKIMRTAGQIYGTDIECGAHPDLRATFYKLLSKKRSAIAVIERTVDMR